MDIELETPEEEANEQRKADGEARQKRNPIIEALDSAVKGFGGIFAKSDPPKMTDELREQQDKESR